MNRRDFLKITGASLVAMTLPAYKALAANAIAASKATTMEKPNIICILSDDVGLGNIGCYGGTQFQTPNIDTLAKTGTQFEYCYSTPLCGPSRCQILTGRYPFRTGLISNYSAAAINPSREIMMPTVLKKAGYATACVGKWGQMSFGPGEWGFNEYIRIHGSGHYWANQHKSYIVDGREKELDTTEYLPDTLHAFAVDFISRHKNQPFYLYYPISHIHSPILRTPDSKPDANDAQLYADNVAYMDKLVGKLVAELDRLHLREKTLIVFIGDNGTAREGATATVHGKPISGQKRSMLEGGSRVPLIVNWPGTTPAGKINHDLTDFSDFFTTFAELGGAPLPTGVTLDGHSFAAQIKGEQGQPREWVYVELDGNSYVRNARYKLTNHGKLFDMTEAPFKEIPVPSDTETAAAIAARKRLQEILDQHPTAPGIKTGRRILNFLSKTWGRLRL